MLKISEDEYLTIKSSVRDKLVVKGSVFLTEASPIQTQKQAEQKIKEVRKKHFSATHNCYAYVLGKGKGKEKVRMHQEICKSSDAGEPRGTAGKQILRAIQTKNLSYVLVVVTRYFGGIKLGTSGLSKAYKESALNALNKCELMKKILKIKISFSFPVNFYGNISKAISRFDCQIINTDFQDEVKLQIQIRKSLVEELKKTLVDSTEGKIKFF